MDDHSLGILAKMLYVLSKKDNFILFVLAKDGLKSTSNTPTRLGLTKKKYYTRLNQLLNVGLIASDGMSDNTYFHTTLGRIIFYNHVVSMMQELKNMKSLIMVDILKNTNRFTDEDIETFLSPIFEKFNLSMPTDNKPTGIKILLSETEVESIIINSIQQCQREVFMATRTYIKSVMRNVALKAVSGVKVRLLADVDLEGYLGAKIEHALVSDHNLLKDIDAMKHLKMQENMSIRKAKVAIEIILIDDRLLIIGLIDRRNIEKFNAAILVEDMTILRSLTAHFMRLWETSEQSPRINVTNAENYHPYAPNTSKDDGHSRRIAQDHVKNILSKAAAADGRINKGTDVPFSKTRPDIF